MGLTDLEDPASLPACLPAEPKGAKLAITHSIHFRRCQPSMGAPRRQSPIARR